MKAYGKGIIVPRLFKSRFTEKLTQAA